jgi:hypothetical protein
MPGRYDAAELEIRMIEVIIVIVERRLRERAAAREVGPTSAGPAGAQLALSQTHRRASEKSGATYHARTGLWALAGGVWNFRDLHN